MYTNRRKFIGSLGTLTVSLPFSKGIAGQSVQYSEAGFATLPYLESLSPTSFIVSIITTTKSLTWLEVGENELTKQVFQVEHGLRRSNTTLFKIKVDNLKPDTEYRYRFVSKPIVNFKPYKVEYGETHKTEIFTFRTPPPIQQYCRALVFNDLHDKAHSIGKVWPEQESQNLDFVAFNGDIFNHLHSETQILQNFLAPISALFSTHTPLVYLRGNHETRGAFAREFVHYFDIPDGKTYQSFRKGPIYWIFLDTGEDKPDDHQGYSGGAAFDALRLEQQAWLLKIVQQEDFKTAPFRVVVMHIPPMHSGNWHGPTQCRDLFVPIFNTHGIDAVLSGHTHRHALHPPAEDNKFALFIGAGPQEGERTVICVEADSKELNIKTIQETSKKKLYNWKKKL